MPLTQPRTRAVRSFLAASSIAVAALAFPSTAAAERVLVKGEDWEAYTDGRAGAFASWVIGQGYPPTVLATDGSTVQYPQGGGWTASTELKDDPATRQADPEQGSVNSMRVRSGFIGNQLGVGVRGQVTPWTKVTGYIQIWAWVESSGRIKNSLNYADVRQGYAKLEGPYGTLTVGRQRALFSRGATDINTMYAHRWGVGFPGAIDSNGPAQGMIGFGVLGSGFAAGFVYATPVLAGFQLSVGAFDPIQLQGNGAFSRTKYVRPEAELTFEQKFGATGKVVLFTNGAYQKIYKDAYCAPNPNLPCDQTAAGFGYGGRFELGPARLGVAGHYGKGLGFNYALEPSDAAIDQSGILRKVDGYYVQSQVVLGKFDLFAGWGIVRAFLTDYDNQDPARSVIKYQMGINGGVVYNLTPNVHIDLEYFRARAAWFLGESQVLNCFASGMTFNW